MFIGIGNPIPEIANLPGPSRPGGGGGAFEYTAIDNSFSMEFDGISSYYYGPMLGDLIDLGQYTSKFSISCWIYAPAPQYKGICGASSFSNGLRIYTYQNTIYFGIGGGASTIVGNATYAGGWHHVAATCDLTSSGTTMYLYFDGNEIANGSGTRNGYDFVNFNLDIGAQNDSNGTPADFWLGNIDEFFYMECCFR